MTDTINRIVAETDVVRAKADALVKDCRVLPTSPNLGSAKVENERYGDQAYAKETKNTGCPRYAEFVVHGIYEKRECGRKNTP